MDIPGVGPLIATAAVATMGEASAFKSGREFSAFIGLIDHMLLKEVVYVCNLKKVNYAHKK